MSKINNMGVDGDELSGFVTLDASEVFVPEGRFRPLNKAKVKEIAESIEKMDTQLQPILVDEMGNLIFGNHRLHACIELGRPVEAKVTTEKDPDKLALMEIDENLLRKELTQTEQENHLAERKRLYNTLYPDTAKKGKKSDSASGKKAFSEDTAETMGVSAKTVERIVKRGECASDELQEARDNKEITTSDMDKIIKETGDDKEAQTTKMKDLIKKKAEIREEKQKEPKVDTAPVDDTRIKELETEVLRLQGEVDKLSVDNDKLKASKKRLQDRIAKAKTANPDVKI